MRLMQGTGALAIGASSFAPSALLHINLLSVTPNNGNVFRTDGHVQQDVAWSMYTGTGVEAAVQRAQFLLSPNTLTQEWNPLESNIYNASENHLRVESTLGDIVFHAHGAHAFQGPSGALTERVRISSVPYDDPHIGGVHSTTRVSISSRKGNEIVNPLAMLHIGDEWLYQKGGHREWMNSGTYIQRKSDNVFFGMRPREKTGVLGDDLNDAVIVWGDNDTPGRLDALRIVFCGLYSGTAAPGEASHLNGLETMRIHPEGNIGLGDFSINGLDEKPSEKLDIVGKLRVRDVPVNTAPDVLIVGLQMDSIGGDYVHNHLAFPDDSTVVLSGTGEWIPGGEGADCRWKDINSVTVPEEEDVYLGFDASEDCYRGKVGIGMKFSEKAKLNVSNGYERDSSGFGIFSNSTVPVDLGSGISNYVVGVHGEAWNKHEVTHNINVGVQGIGMDSRYAVGVNGVSIPNPNGSGTGVSIGVRGIAQNYPNSGSTYHIGIYAEAVDHSAVMVGGNPVFSATPVIISDESIKNSIEEIEGAGEILEALNPKSYYYHSPENRAMAMDQDLQFGFIAQEVQEVLPDLVQLVKIPELLDTLGVVEGTSAELLGVKYNAFIPLLVAGFQEQNALLSAQSAAIEAQNEIIASLQEQLQSQTNRMSELQDDISRVMAALQQAKSDVNNCCGNSATGQTNQGTVLYNGVVLEQNIPNPFERKTSISFELPVDAQVRLDITDAEGKLIEVLLNERFPIGRHVVQWDASHLPSGLYHYSIYVDTLLLTKRMIKI